MKVVNDQTIQKETVIIDDTEFRSCTFVKCTLNYTGGKFGLINCAAEDCFCEFFGPAARTILFLQKFGLLAKDPSCWPIVAKKAKKQSA